MNYLVLEGYKDAAEKFQKESGTEPEIDLNSIANRMAIRNAIQSGNIEEGIHRVNKLNCEILARNSKIRFHLHQQRFIEMIRNGRILQALEFAQQELAPQGEENNMFLQELEKTLSLLAFEDHTNSPVGYLMLSGQRQKIASELNAAILSSQCQEEDPKLPTLFKLMKWSQMKLDEKLRYPKISNFTTAAFEEPKE